MGRRVVAAIEAQPDNVVVGVGRAQTDFCDASAVDRLVAEVAPHAIVHLAGVVPSSARAAAGLADNVTMTRAVASASERHGVQRVVLASSAAVYGDSHDFALTEDQPLDARSDYARSKLESEAVLAAADVESVALRIFNIFGPGFDDSLVHRLITSEAADPLPVRGLDVFIRDYIHVDDVAEAVLRAVQVPLSAKAVVNVGTGVAMSTRELIRALSREHELHYVETEGTPSVSFADTSVAQRLLSFRASRSVTDG